MSVFKTQHEKKSFRVTAVLMLLVLLVLTFVGLTYLIPPPESGIAVNFGNTDTGSGPVQTSMPVPKEIQQPPPKPTPNIPESTQKAEEVLTQDQEESVVIPEKKEKIKPQEKKISQAEEKPQPKKEEKPKPDASTTDALNNILNATATQGDNNSKSDGINGGEGDQGNPNGDKNVKNYYGNSATGTGGNYQLGDRNAINKPKPDYICNEEGTVVVRVDVDRNGKVVYAQAGIRGTTNNAPCLLEQARIAALKTTWQPKADAPNTQTGQIIYQFSLKN